uniref:TOG domain-containing protein n=1 Tax=Mesocestoides corti TaxID=53468 RepID=A0A5K3EUU2_MESCO
MSEHIQKLSSKRWNERKEALDIIDAKLRKGTCTPVEATDLVCAVINVMSTDTHLQLVAAAANIITRAATSMKQEFSSLSRQTLMACLSGFRTSKPFVISALRSAADASLNTLSIDVVTEAVLACLADKTSNPNAMEEAVSLLGRAFLQTPDRLSSSLPARRALFKRLLVPLLPLMEARTDGLRDATCNTIAAAKVFLADDSAYSRLTQDTLGEAKRARVDQAFNRLTTAINSEGSSNVEAMQMEDKAADEGNRTPCRRTAAKLNPPAGGEQESLCPPQAKKSKTAPRAANSTQPSGAFVAEHHLSEDELRRILSQVSISENVVNHLNSSNWRERFESVNKLYSAVPNLSLESPAFSQSVLRLLLESPGFKEPNLQVKCRFLETIAAILTASKAPFLCESLFETLVCNLAVAIGNPKNLPQCEACFVALQRATDLAVVSDAVLRLAATAKLPKSAEHLILWLSLAIERSGFCLSYPKVAKYLKDGFTNASNAVRHAYVKLAGAIYTSQNPANSSTLRTDLESATKPAIAALLLAEFEARQKPSCEVATGQSQEALRANLRRTVTEAPLSPPVEIHRQPDATSRRMTAVLNSPSEALQRSLCHVVDNVIPEDSFVNEERSPLGLSSTFCATSVPLLTANFKAKEARLAQLATGSSHPSRERLEEKFVEAGVHPNLRRMLTHWDSDPDKTKETLVLLSHILLQQTPVQQQATDKQQHHHQELLFDTLANSDLLFHWMVESCFSAGKFDPDVVSQALDYLDEFITRLADAKLTLAPAEIGILLPWPLFSPPLLNRYFSQSSDRCRRLTGLLFGLCRVVSANQIYFAVMEAISMVTETHIVTELLVLVKLLIARFPSLPGPTVADIKAIAQHVASPDASVIQAALECLRAVRGNLTTQQISAMAGKLTERDRALLQDALNQNPSMPICTTPLRPKTPITDGALNVSSYTNNPSILASVSRSHLAQCSHLVPSDDCDELLRVYREWMLDVLAEDNRDKEAQMVSFLVSNLITAPTTDNVDRVDSALMAISHLNFLHHSTATRDLLLPEASTLVENLGLQMSCVANGGVAAFDYTAVEACRFVRSTVGFVISIFRASFLTRDLAARSLSQVIAGLLRLEAVFDLINRGQFDGLPIKGSMLSLLVDLDVSRPLGEDMVLTLEFIHEKLMMISLSTYIISLTNLSNPQWNGYFGMDGDLTKRLLAHNHLYLHMFDLATQKLAELRGDDVDEVLKALSKLHPFETQSAFHKCLWMMALGWNRLRR